MFTAAVEISLAGLWVFRRVILNKENCCLRLILTRTRTSFHLVYSSFILTAARSAGLSLLITCGCCSYATLFQSSRYVVYLTAILCVFWVIHVHSYSAHNDTGVICWSSHHKSASPDDTFSVTSSYQMTNVWYRYFSVDRESVGSDQEDIQRVQHSKMLNMCWLRSKTIGDWLNKNWIKILIFPNFLQPFWMHQQPAFYVLYRSVSYSRVHIQPFTKLKLKWKKLKSVNEINEKATKQLIAILKEDFVKYFEKVEKHWEESVRFQWDCSDDTIDRGWLLFSVISNGYILVGIYLN